MSKHYIGMSGSHGCLPQYTTVSTSLRTVVDDLANLHELKREQKKELKETWLVELDPDQGAEYAEVVECSCDEPKTHEED